MCYRKVWGGGAASPLILRIIIGGRTVVALSYHKVKGEVHNRRFQALGRGDRSWTATELRLNNYDSRTRSRCQANSSGDSGWAATAMRMQGQVNCPLDEPPESR